MYQNIQRAQSNTSSTSTRFCVSVDEAKTIAQRLLSKYDMGRNGRLQQNDMGFILKDIYSQTQIPYAPQQRDNQSFFSVLDSNKDNQITLEDLEKACIRVLCDGSSPQPNPVQDQGLIESYKRSAAVARPQQGPTASTNQYTINTQSFGGTPPTTTYSTNQSQQYTNLGSAPYKQSTSFQYQTNNNPTKVSYGQYKQVSQNDYQNHLRQSSLNQSGAVASPQYSTAQVKYSTTNNYQYQTNPQPQRQVNVSTNYYETKASPSPPMSSANSYNKYVYPTGQSDAVNVNPSQNDQIRSPASSFDSTQFNGIFREKNISGTYLKGQEAIFQKADGIMHDPQYLKQEDVQMVSHIKADIKNLNSNSGSDRKIFNNKSKEFQSHFNTTQLFQGGLDNTLKNNGKLQKMKEQFSLKSNAVVKCTPGPKLQQIMQQCQQRNQKFTDHEFPPNNASLSKNGTWWDGGPIPYVDWMRADDHYRGDYDLFIDGIMPGDIMQGELGDCYFQCTLAALAEWPERIQRIFSTQQKNQFGVYSVWIVWSGVKQEVVIDDNLWCSKYENRLVSMRTQQNEIWAQLIEKAWAKLNGDYCSIDGGFARDCLHDLTGAPVIHYRIREDSKWKKWQYILWKQLLEGEKQDFIMCGGTYSGKDKWGNYIEGDTETRDGIYYTHAYSILAAYEVEIQGQKHDLIKFRNPHGEGEWNGPFSDRDPIWKRVSQSEKERIGYCNEDDGVFFMEYQTLRDYFEDVQICQYRDYYEYEGVQINQSQAGEIPHFLKIQVPEQGHYYFQVNQIARATFSEETQYRYTQATCNVVDSNGKLISACTGKQKNICSYKTQQNYQQIPPGTYYVMAKVNFDQHQLSEGVTKFGFGVYGKGKVSIQNNAQIPPNIQNALVNARDEVLPNFTL